MEVLKIIVLSLGSIIVLFILTKIVGQREMSGLSIFDFMIAITIGSIAAEMATSLEDNFVQPLIAMAIYAVVTLVISIINMKFVKLRPFCSGKTLILYDNGTLFKENFKNRLKKLKNIKRIKISCDLIRVKFVQYIFK